MRIIVLLDYISPENDVGFAPYTRSSLSVFTGEPLVAHEGLCVLMRAIAYSAHNTSALLSLRHSHIIFVDMKVSIELQLLRRILL